MIFISPPFGNYIKIPGFISITGSFTLEKRDGLILQLIKTLRYSTEHQGYINKIGLRNPGIDYAISKYKNDNENITSIAIINETDIPKLVNKIPDNMNIEINVSCPNIDKNMISKGIHPFLNPSREWCIIKLSPLVTMDEIDNYYKLGFRQFHCSNTLSTINGGLSGKTLIPYNTNIIRKIKNKYPNCEVIGGGGVTDIHVYNLYKLFGADHISISTLFFNPFNLGIFLYNIYKRPPSPPPPAPEPAPAPVPAPALEQPVMI